MSNVNLNGYKVSEISFVNTAENGKKLQLQNKYSYNVKYANNGTCVGELGVEVYDKEAPEVFKVKLVMIGVFSITNQEATKETLHIETYKDLFPYARVLISNLTVNAGVPPIILQGMDIEKQSIYKIEKNPPEDL